MLYMATEALNKRVNRALGYHHRFFLLPNFAVWSMCQKEYSGNQSVQLIMGSGGSQKVHDVAITQLLDVPCLCAR